MFSELNTGFIVMEMEQFHDEREWLLEFERKDQESKRIGNRIVVKAWKHFKILF